MHVQRTITPKLRNQKLWFMRSARHLIVLYIFIKFRENISNGIRVMERPRMLKALTDVRTADGQKDIQNFIISRHKKHNEGESL